MPARSAATVSSLGVDDLPTDPDQAPGPGDGDGQPRKDTAVIDLPTPISHGELANADERRLAQGFSAVEPPNEFPPGPQSLIEAGPWWGRVVVALLVAIHHVLPPRAPLDEWFQDNLGRRVDGPAEGLSDRRLVEVRLPGHSDIGRDEEGEEGPARVGFAPDGFDPDQEFGSLSRELLALLQLDRVVAVCARRAGTSQGAAGVGDSMPGDDVSRPVSELRAVGSAGIHRASERAESALIDPTSGYHMAAHRPCT